MLPLVGLEAVMSLFDFMATPLGRILRGLLGASFLLLGVALFFVGSSWLWAPAVIGGAMAALSGASNFCALSPLVGASCWRDGQSCFTNNTRRTT